MMLLLLLGWGGELVVEVVAVVVVVVVVLGDGQVMATLKSGVVIVTAMLPGPGVWGLGLGPRALGAWARCLPRSGWAGPGCLGASPRESGAWAAPPRHQKKEDQRHRATRAEQIGTAVNELSETQRNSAADRIKAEFKIIKTARNVTGSSPTNAQKQTTNNTQPSLYWTCSSRSSWSSSSSSSSSSSCVFACLLLLFLLLGCFCFGCC